MGKTPLFCTFGVHKLDYKSINFKPCDYAFIPFYVRGGDTFTDDSNAIIKELINAASTSTRTSFAISFPNENRSAVIGDISSSAGKAKIKEYWTSKKIYHYAVFDIGVKKSELSEEKMIIGEAFGLLREVEYVILDVIGNKERTTFASSLSCCCRKFPLDAVIILTHMTFDEFEAKLPCAISAAAPYKLLDIVNILDMRTVMTKMSKQVPWVMRTTLTISTSFCTRVYLAKRFAYLDQECIDSMNHPNGTAAFCNVPSALYDNLTIDRKKQITGRAKSKSNTRLMTTFETNETIYLKYCKLRKEFADVPFGLSIFDLECEDWGNTCTSQPDLPIAGTKRFTEVTDYYVTASNWSKDNFPCDYEK
ncbi:hypothetical protein MRX96_059647 [Rhipicephalus microplus]